MRSSIVFMQTSLSLVALLFFSTVSYAVASEPLSIRDPKGQEIVASKNVTCASFSKDANGADLVTFKLDDEGAMRLNETTKANIGKKIAIIICGKKSNQPEIAGEVNGKTVLNFGLTPKQKACLAKAFEIESKCAD